jgi:hypothetical protein
VKVPSQNNRSQIRSRRRRRPAHYDTGQLGNDRGVLRGAPIEIPENKNANVSRASISSTPKMLGFGRAIPLRKLCEKILMLDMMNEVAKDTFRWRINTPSSMNE